MKITEYRGNKKTEIISRLLTLIQALEQREEAKELLLELLVVVTKETSKSPRKWSSKPTLENKLQ